MHFLPVYNKQFTLVLHLLPLIESFLRIHIEADHMFGSLKKMINKRGVYYVPLKLIVQHEFRRK